MFPTRRQWQREMVQAPEQTAVEEAQQQQPQALDKTNRYLFPYRCPLCGEPLPRIVVSGVPFRCPNPQCRAYIRGGGRAPVEDFVRRRLQRVGIKDLKVQKLPQNMLMVAWRETRDETAE